VDPQAFGRAIAALREEKGLTQKEIVERVPTFYSDEGAYGRIERGTRRPQRGAAIAIVQSGLRFTSPREINQLIALAGYTALTNEELRNLRLEPETEPVSVPVIRTAVRGRLWQPLANSDHFRIASSLSVGSAVLVGALLAWRLPEPVMTLAACMLYAALYGVSILLESSHGPERRRPEAAAVGTFCFVLVTSIIALSVDYHTAQKGRIGGLPLGLGVFLGMAVAQWMMTRSALPDTVIVAATFRARTAQAAHLKNTGYFLLIVLFSGYRHFTPSWPFGARFSWVILKRCAVFRTDFFSLMAIFWRWPRSFCGSFSASSRSSPFR